jgi:hypothetical protein
MGCQRAHDLNSWHFCIYLFSHLHSIWDSLLSHNLINKVLLNFNFCQSTGKKISPCFYFIFKRWGSRYLTLLRLVLNFWAQVTLLAHTPEFLRKLDLAWLLIMPGFITSWFCGGVGDWTRATSMWIKWAISSVLVSSFYCTFSLRRWTF